MLRGSRRGEKGGIKTLVGTSTAVTIKIVYSLFENVDLAKFYKSSRVSASLC